jgi:hypothetical protein
LLKRSNILIVYIQHFLSKRKFIRILLGGYIELSIVNINAQLSIFLRNNDNGRYPSNFFYRFDKTSLKKLINVLFDNVGIVRVHSITNLMCRWYILFQLNAMLGHIRRNLLENLISPRKHILVLPK